VNTHRVRPADLPDGKIVGFFGLVSEWVDQELLVKLAEAIPTATIALLGKEDVDVSRLRAAANIARLGPRSFDVLPDYAAHFDAGIIPFRVNELTRAVNPIKLREMLAAGCAVVTTNLPEAETLAGRVPHGGLTVARDQDSFVSAVKRHVAEGWTADQRRAVSNSMRHETWAVKTEEICRKIEEAGRRSESGINNQ
jgi:glycosyltransferase involved in cell wall biosynthesis